MGARRNNRPDHTGPHEREFRRNRQKILNTQDICAICGQPVDKTLKYPHPYSASVDHMIPLNKGGHPSAVGNLALAHLRCNRLKSDHLPTARPPEVKKERTFLMDWT